MKSFKQKLVDFIENNQLDYKTLDKLNLLIDEDDALDKKIIRRVLNVTRGNAYVGENGERMHHPRITFQTMELTELLGWELGTEVLLEFDIARQQVIIRRR